MTSFFRLALPWLSLSTAACGATRDDDGPTTTPPSTSGADATAPRQPTMVAGQTPGTIPAGQELLGTTLSSERG